VTPLVDAVTFDHWNTLVFETDVDGSNLAHRRLDAWIARLHEEGHAVEREMLSGTFATVWEAFTVDWHAGVQRTGEDAARQALSILDLPITDELHGELVEHFVDAGRHVDFALTEGLEDLLQTLKAAGIKLGIVCDVGFTPSSHLREHLERRGLLKYFDGWSFSDDVGFYKPAKEIFDHALETVGHPESPRVAHIGDLRRTDVAGALGMGMIAVRYAGVFDDPAENGPDATFTIDHFAQLPELLGL
jgi:HAD superfamily hydrolase (TIGR01549 family)